MEVLAVILRATHIAFAIVVAGAAFYQLAILRPSLADSDAAERKALLSRNLSRWRPVVFLSIALLLVTGLVNFVAFRVPLFRGLPNAGFYHALFGLKFLAALAAFHAATVLVLPGEKFDAKYRSRAGFWLTYLVTLFALMVVLGSVMNVMTQDARAEKARLAPDSAAARV